MKLWHWAVIVLALLVIAVISVLYYEWVVGWTQFYDCLVKLSQPPTNGKNLTC